MKNEKGKKKKEKGRRLPGGSAPERELSVGCPGKNYELRIWVTDLHRLALIPLPLNPLLLTLLPNTPFIPKGCLPLRGGTVEMKKEKGKRSPVAE